MTIELRLYTSPKSSNSVGKQELKLYQSYKINHIGPVCGTCTQEGNWTFSLTIAILLNDKWQIYLGNIEKIHIFVKLLTDQLPHKTAPWYSYLTSPSLILTLQSSATQRSIQFTLFQQAVQPVPSWEWIWARLWIEHALYPRGQCFVLTSESLWPYQQWNACDKSHWESAVEKQADMCKTISIYPRRSPILF